MSMTSCLGIEDVIEPQVVVLDVLHALDAPIERLRERIGRAAEANEGHKLLQYVVALTRGNRQVEPRVVSSPS